MRADGVADARMVPTLVPTRPFRAILPETLCHRAESYGSAMAGDSTHEFMGDMRESFDRLQTMVAELHPAAGADPAKAELLASLKRELESLRGGLEQLERAVDEWPSARERIGH